MRSASTVCNCCVHGEIGGSREKERCGPSELSFEAKRLVGK